ncbi:MAG: gamma-glutamylcyclotransferase [Deltaproteobacteria bacterium]|nr:gamma-glutamylcyclotransferase [Deltaproteobacteria bacterium]
MLCTPIGSSPLPFRLVCYNIVFAMADEVDLFVYGTLMNESVLCSLTGRSFPRYEAELSGFERFTPNHGYPYIVPNPRARVRGILLTGIDQAALAALDRYEEEGQLYHRCRVEVTVDGCRVSCETYVGNVEALRAD